MFLSIVDEHVVQRWKGMWLLLHGRIKGDTEHKSMILIMPDPTMADVYYSETCL